MLIDLELVGDRAVSSHPVKFRYGESYGSGRDLEIILASDAGRPGGGFRTGKVKSLLLKRDVVMHLSLDDPALARRSPSAAQPPRDGSTLKITCQGAFEYDFNLYAASFHDAVNVLRLATGPSDQLNCELLSVFFEQGSSKPPADALPAGAPQRLYVSSNESPGAIQRLLALPDRPESGERILRRLVQLCDVVEVEG